MFMDLESATGYVQQGSHCRQANNRPGIRATLKTPETVAPGLRKAGSGIAVSPPKRLLDAIPGQG